MKFWSFLGIRFSIYKAVIISACFMAILAACASTTPLALPQDVRSIVDFTKHLRDATSAGLSPTLGATLRDATRAIDPQSQQSSSAPISKLKPFSHQEVDRPGYRGISTWWCPRHQLVRDAREVSDQFGKVCLARRGQWSPPLCIEPTMQQPLFFARTTVQQYSCGANVPMAVVTALEPKGSLDAHDYRAAIQVEMR